MPTTPTFDSASHLRSTQIVVLALAIGVVGFAAVAAFVGPVGQAMPPIVYGLDPIAIAAIASTLGLVPMAFFLPQRMVDSARDQGTDQRVQTFRASRMIAAALCEGPALLWCVGLLLSGTWWFLAPIAMLAGLIVMQVPTREAFEAATGLRPSDS